MAGQVCIAPNMVRGGLKATGNRYGDLTLCAGTGYAAKLDFAVAVMREKRGMLKSLVNCPVCLAKFLAAIGSA